MSVKFKMQDKADYLTGTIDSSFHMSGSCHCEIPCNVKLEQEYKQRANKYLNIHEWAQTTRYHEISETRALQGTAKFREEGEGMMQPTFKL